MPNIHFELDRLRTTLQNRGISPSTVDAIIEKASREIFAAFEQHGDSAMQQAIGAGVEKQSPDFINELQLDMAHMMLVTQSGNMDFSEPPFPMLPSLLKNAKPIKDGSGVYKIIPVGEPGKKRPIATNIYDSYKQLNAERMEAAMKQYAAVAPKNSRNTKFRTATSKQDPSTKWVRPATTKQFDDEMKSINNQLATTMEDAIRDIIRTYEEGF